jgi:oxygen-dependent protoporphyrinogen oxidase
MATLIGALAARLGPALRCGAGVTSLGRAGAEWRVVLADGRSLAADRVLLALPAARAAAIVRGLDPDFAGELARFPFAGIVMVALAFRAADLRPLDGYGYLVSRAEGLDTLGVLWESSVFERRAPSGMALLRVMMGGMRRPEVADLEDADLVPRARAELARVMRIRAEPARTWVRRWPQAIAQYELGHGRRVAAARARAALHPGLELCGTSYDGVSFGSAVRSGDAAARRVIAAVAAAARTEPPTGARVPALGAAGGAA